MLIKRTTSESIRRPSTERPAARFKPIRYGKLGSSVTYRVTGNININGGTTINNLSIFSGGEYHRVYREFADTLIGRDLA